MSKGRWVASVVTALMLGASGASASEWQAGLRWAGALNNDAFQRTELAGQRELPSLGWRWEDWRLRTDLSLSLGRLEAKGEHASLVSLGPSFTVRQVDAPWAFSFSVSPTLISEHEFPHMDLGGSLQFTLEAGLDYRLGPRLGVGYRVQHMSNAYRYEANPGVDLHMIRLDWRF
ncbi:acyloxyacyl hydrolase [Alkalilimnicola sp. S0819]|uniref:acyloxyacyl hydrolase n=1 Tax=Alkalilimnicola sp. S0819 TaxID=2613922 RepID=UPI0012616603|nr:acyloxyacyl hydrolase [Alkalilimnicola sp. S0819]KAB7623032.1 acyloxyacyl hydrolase [Alkalilimnicola sp. S0819]MPQ17145.1 hypothetical protein [Alkalilimnicola sp. S0819]